MITPKELYFARIESGEYKEDKHQQEVIFLLNEIYLKLLPRLRKSIFRGWFTKHQTPVKGLYLWGGVGIGKTWLMDLFCHCLPKEKTLRMHFHQFMSETHQQLKLFSDKKNPLELIAKKIAQQYQVICFDEFFVSDITDAMLLAGLFKALFANGLTLVTTSNVAPDDLYKGGISRDRFLPAIDLIKHNTHVRHISSTNDYRMQTLATSGVYLTPLGEATRAKMRRIFETVAGDNFTENELITIHGRAIQTLRRSQNVIWFLFEDICSIPRSQEDYLELAKSYHTIIVSNIPKLESWQINEVIYLINLVDVLYDANIRLFVSCECAIDDIYRSGQKIFEFERTKSRLYEMQSLEYLQRHHKY